MALNYIGSKLSLLNFIHYVVDIETNGDVETIGDLFAGTGIVGLSFKKKGFKIISNDIQYYSYVINSKLIGINKIPHFEELISILPHLKNVKEDERIPLILKTLNEIRDYKEGFIYQNYSRGGTKNKEHERLYFSDENALLIDTIRQKIEEWAENNKINKEEYFYLLATLLEASDKIANTASVYGAFLKQLKKSALKKLELKENKIIKSDKEHSIFNNDILNILNNEKIDLLYLDPPYNARQYATNYHMLETISRYDNPKISGKTGLREYQNQKSNFCSKNKVKEEFEKIVKSTNAKYILLSYNNEGLMSLKEVQEILSLRGKPRTYICKYKRFKADKTENRNHKANSTYEYLHFVKCEDVSTIKKVQVENPIIIEVDNLALNRQTDLI